MTEDKDLDPSIPLDNAKHEKFAHEYILNGANATKAAITVGYSAHSAKNQGHLLITKYDQLSKRIKYLQNLEWEKDYMSIAERKSRLARMGRGDLKDYAQAGPDGAHYVFGEESPNTQAVAEVSQLVVDDGGAMITKLKLHDPKKAIDLLNKMDGVYVEKHEVETTVNVVEIPAQVDAPVAPDSE